MLEVEQEKQLVQLSMFKYSENLKRLGNIDEFLNKFIEEKKRNIENKDFCDEDSFLSYLANSF